MKKAYLYLACVIAVVFIGTSIGHSMISAETKRVEKEKTEIQAMWNEIDKIDKK